MNAACVVSVLACASIAIAWTYFRRYELARPPVGVFGAADVALMLAAIVGAPFAYLALPTWAVGIVFCLLALNVAWFALEPALVHPRRVWIAALAVVGGNAATTLLAGAGTTVAIAANDVALIILAAVAANMLAQSGLAARHLVLLSAALAGYDVLATTETGLMRDLLTRVAPLPFAPLVVWRSGEAFLGIGLGDVLMLALAPLVLRKAFGRRAGIVAAAVSAVTAAIVTSAVATGVLGRALPVLVLLGPLVIGQVAFWRMRRGSERTTADYLAQEPSPSRITRERLALLRDSALVAEGR